MKTIRMRKGDAEKWLAALRSGEYKQAKRTLYDLEDGGYCCLGVLQHCLTGDVQRDSMGNPKSVPTFVWLREMGIEFSTSYGEPDVVPAIKITKVGTGEVLVESAAAINDLGVSFLQIADALEKVMKTYEDEQIGESA